MWPLPHAALKIALILTYHEVLALGSSPNNKSQEKKLRSFGLCLRPSPSHVTGALMDLRANLLFAKGAQHGTAGSSLRAKQVKSKVVNSEVDKLQGLPHRQANTKTSPWFGRPFHKQSPCKKSLPMVRPPPADRCRPGLSSSPPVPRWTRSPARPRPLGSPSCGACWDPGSPSWLPGSPAPNSSPQKNKAATWTNSEKNKNCPSMPLGSPKVLPVAGCQFPQQT